MANLLYHRKRVDVKEITEKATSWRSVYTLYKDAFGNYYTDLGEGGEELENLGTFEDEQQAIKAFFEYIAELEKENN